MPLDPEADRLALRLELGHAARFHETIKLARDNALEAACRGILGVEHGHFLEPCPDRLGAGFDAFSFLKNSELTLYQVIEWLFHFKSSHTFVNINVDMYCSVLNSVAITCENAPLSP